jgi:hypothetical protein
MEFELKQGSVAQIIVGVIVAAVVGGIGIVVITNTLLAVGITGGLWYIIYILIPAIVIIAIVMAFMYLTK